MVTVDDVLSVLRYEPDTGYFYWRVRRGRQTAGSRAGTLTRGYVVINCNMTGLIRAHRLAWFIMTGDMLPSEEQIDHKNRIPHDNRWCNLRLATPGENSANASRRSDNTTGHPGVHLYKANGRYTAYVQRDGRMNHLGYFETKEAAISARLAAEAKIFGAFAPNNPISD